MNLTKLKLKNFLSYADSTINFNESGIYMIYGLNLQTGSNNGVGKSAIKEAIQYALFGNCRVSSADDVIRFNNDEMAVSIKFQLDEKEIIIKRSRIRNKSTNLTVLINGRDISQKSLKLTDEYIQNLLGIDYEKFMHSFCFGQSEYDDLKKLTSTKLIEFLKSVLKLDRFNQYLERVKELKEENNDKINRLLGMKDSYSKIVDVNVNKKDLEKQVDKYTKKYEKVKEQIKPLLKEHEEIELELDSIGRDIQTQTNDYNKMIKQLNHIKESDTCPTCKQKLINDDLVASLKKETKKLRDGMRIAEDKYHKLNIKFKILDTELDKINNIFEEYKEQINELKMKLKLSLQNKVDIVEVDKEYTKALQARGVLVGLTDVFGNKGLPLFILNEKVPKLEFLVNDILKRVCDFKIHLRTTKELKSKETRNTCEIELTKGNRIYPLENLSNGEEFIITLAFRVGISKLYQTETKFETLILDECFGSLGSSNRRKVLALINSLENDFKKIIIITHVDEIRDWRKPHKIEIEKDKDISKIIYNN